MQRPMINTILLSELLLQFRKQRKDSAIPLANKDPTTNTRQRNKDKQKRKRKGKDQGQASLQGAPHSQEVSHS
jgi:hypothetical protein